MPNVSATTGHLRMKHKSLLPRMPTFRNGYVVDKKTKKHK